MFAAAPITPVALNVTDPATPGAPAVSVFAPAVFPSVQLPTVAMPSPFVVWDAPVTDPPPLVTAKVTVAPATAFPFASAILTDGGFATVAPTSAVCPFDAEFATVIAAAGPAEKFTVALLDSVEPAIDAVITAGPAAVAEVSVAV